MTVLAYIISGEAVDDTVSNRTVRQILSLSGLNPDADFPGFLTSVGLGTGIAGQTTYWVTNNTLGSIPAIFPLTLPGYYGYLSIDAAGTTRWRELTEVNDGNSGATINIDYSGGLNHLVTVTANCTFTFSNPFGGEVTVLKMIQDGTGGWIVTWPTNVIWGTDGEPAWVTTAGATNIAVFYFDGTNYYGKYITLGA